MSAVLPPLLHRLTTIYAEPSIMAVTNLQAPSVCRWAHLGVTATVSHTRTKTKGARLCCLHCHANNHESPLRAYHDHNQQSLAPLPPQRCQETPLQACHAATAAATTSSTPGIPTLGLLQPAIPDPA
eukprot:g27779.t1